MTDHETRAELHAAVDRLEGDELAIVSGLVRRLEQGRSVYGPWRVDGERLYVREALEECLDALHYLAARLIQLGGNR